MKTLKFFTFLMILLLGASFYGCYTELASRPDRHSRTRYKDYDRIQDTARYDDRYSDEYSDQDTNYYADDGNYDNDGTTNNYYYGDYRPFYRRYYWGYHPGFSIGVGWDFYDPYWYDNYCYFDPYWGYYNYPIFSRPYWGYYSYWGYPYYYYGGNYTKSRNYGFTRLRNNDGSRGIGSVRTRDLISGGRNRAISTSTVPGRDRLYKTGGTSGSDTRTGRTTARTIDRRPSGTSRERVATPGSTNTNRPNVERRNPRPTYERPRGERSRSENSGSNSGSRRQRREQYRSYYQQRYGSPSENGSSSSSNRTYSSPRYSAPRSQSSSGSSLRSYSAPSSRGNSGGSSSSRSSSGGGESRGGGGERRGR
ncbi:MAG: hypothetical protein Q8940_03220 [Bacteroidota bacterium]|nr:hypothetical protein [Bacteroidota bacterium]